MNNQDVEVRYSQFFFLKLGMSQPRKCESVDIHVPDTDIMGSFVGNKHVYVSILIYKGGITKHYSHFIGILGR